MELGEHVQKYLIAMQVGSYGVKWTLALQTSGGQEHKLTLPAQEVQNAMELVRGDVSLYFEPKTQTLSTGWNDPGA